MRSMIGGGLLLAAAALATPAEAAAGAGLFDWPTLLFLVLAGIVIFLGLGSMQRKQRVQAVETVVHGNFADYTLEVLANAAKIDGRVDDAERQAITDVMTQIKGAPFARTEADAALLRARLNKDQLIAYLSARARTFTLDQKTALLKGVLSVAMADGHFHEREHAIYLDYIAAVGFERKTAPEILQRWVHDMAAGKYS